MDTSHPDDGAGRWGGSTRPQGAALRALLARAQGLKAGLSVGRDGLTPAFLAEVGGALANHPLLKVRIDVADRCMADDIAGDLARATRSCLLKRIGRVAIMYRPDPQEVPRE